MIKTCKAPDCDRTDIKGYGYCSKHYQRLKANGHINRTQTPKGLAQKHPIEYRTYYSMKNRCYNSNNPAFKNYGGRGIVVDTRWLGANGFSNFLSDMGERPSDEYSIDRIDVNKEYSKNNCRWATVKQQANNRRSSKNITYNGETKSISEWAEEYNLQRNTLSRRLKNKNWSTEKAITTPPNNDHSLSELAKAHGKKPLLVYKRLKLGWSLDDALNRPVGYHRCKKIVEYNGVKKPLTDWCREFNIDYDTVVKRLEYGWTPEEAFTLEKDPYTPRANR